MAKPQKSPSAVAEEPKEDEKDHLSVGNTGSSMISVWFFWPTIVFDAWMMMSQKSN